MADFSPNRELLNPKFEGYKLQVISPGIARHGLPYKPTQVTTSGRSPLSLQEVQSRITHNHLVLSPAPGRALYIDADHRVVVVDIDPTDITKSPRFDVVYELPVAISTAQTQSETIHREYPSAAFLADDTAFVGDGRGSLYILSIPARGPATLVSSFELFDREATSLPLPFRIHSVARVSDGTVVALLSSRHYDTEVLSSLTQDTAATSSPHLRHLHHHHSSEFDVWAARFTFPLNMMQVDSGTLDIVWRRRGEDVPMLAVYDASRSAYALIGSSTYREIGAPHTPAHEPSPDEIAPIPRAGEDLDASDNTTLPKPYPYSWTQTADVVTVAFPLPSSTPKSSISVLFSPTTLTVHVKGVPGNIGVEGVWLPHYSAKQLWDRVRPSTSFWTWDREGEHKFGILSVHLDKMTEGQKWMHVFAAAGTRTSTPSEAASEGYDDMDVPETLDPSELYLIREALEKYTEALRTGEDASGLGLGRGVPSLAQGEMDDEVDDSVGRLASFTWVSEDGSAPPWWKRKDSSTSPFNLLSTAFPGTDAKLVASLVVKNSIDGLLYAADGVQSGGGDTIAPEWKHTGTFPALAFVLASKRDTRFSYHTQNAIFAFENGSVDRGGNVYIYRRSSPNQLWAKQSVLKVGDGNAGSLLGVCALKSNNKSDSTTIVCLCENQLVVLYDIF